MGKNRPQIPPPVLTPPSASAPAEPAPAPAAPPAAAPALAVVPPPPRVASVQLLADRIVLTNPTIRLDAYVFLPGTQTQTDTLKPASATIMHGEIVIEELGLIWPIAKAHIRTR
jgi:hypothetical protein